MTFGPPLQLSETIEGLRACGIVPVVELQKVAQAEPLLDALCTAGLAVAEITLRTEAGIRAIELLAKAYPQALIGAGTVRSAEDAARVIDAGASFVVAPALDVELVKVCGDRGVLAIPGVCTPTEVNTALKAGASLLKFFPAEASGGTGFLSALAGPFREARFVATGGIRTDNLASYLALPQVWACGGSWMVAPRLLEACDFGQVAKLAAEAVAVVTEARRRG
jgi:2-dehydro-3-deoxyphosphogluconate aldolase/(4S)-4-hydroxy-2-oxoglutarate aldolase